MKSTKYIRADLADLRKPATEALREAVEAANYAIAESKRGYLSYNNELKTTHLETLIQSATAQSEPTGDDVRISLEHLHADRRLVTGSYNYQCGFLDALNAAKESISAALAKGVGE